MNLKKDDYLKRLIDNKIDKYLSIFKAIQIVGPKWCGKTWTALEHAKSVSFVTDKSTQNLARIDPKYIFQKESPQLIDEWQIVPSIWDAVRNECDQTSKKGRFILTGSTTLVNEIDDKNELINHTGTGRIIQLSMSTMSLYEAGFSTGEVSLLYLFSNKAIKEGYVRKIELNELASYIIRGGWPDNIKTPIEDCALVSKNYLNSVISKDINERKDRKRNPEKMKALIQSLARNESTIAKDSIILKDINETGGTQESVQSRDTYYDYYGVLQDLYLINNQKGYSPNYRSSARLSKGKKRHLIDPSLSAAALGLTSEKLIGDLKTFGFLFEALVERDLSIYMNYYDGDLLYFRDNVSGDEVDAICEMKDGSYGAIEIKLSENGIEEAIKSLKTFYKNVMKKPTFMCVIVGHLEAVIKDKESGIYIVPFTSLKP